MNTFQPDPPRQPLKRFWLTPSLVILMLAAGTVVWLGAQANQSARIGPNSADPAYIVVSTSTPVTFTSVISDAGLRKHDPKKVVLVRTDASGTPIDILGRMLDNGKRADAKRNDHTYTIRVTLNESTVGPIYFRVAAKFSDALPRFGKDEDEDWDRDLAGLNESLDRAHRHDRLPPLLRKLQGYTLSDPITVTVDPFKLPPDPGEAGKQTLAGIDSDHDGVRDDVQRYIQLEYQSSARTRAALSQYAAGLIDFLQAGSGSAPLADAVHCLAYSLPSSEAHLKMVEIKAIVLNTRARSRAFVAANSSTRVLSGDAPSTLTSCRINPDTLPN